MPDRTPILLDTDVGSDIDDALCLAYLLRQPRCELVGITTVTGEPERRAMLADAICRAEGRQEIPIHAGSARPILGDQRQETAPQAAALDRWPHRQEFEPATAVPFMREAIRSRPGEITLLAIGPMTNLGLLFALDAGIPSMLRGLVLMCGAFGRGPAATRRAETNAAIDPHATAVVYQARPPRHLSIGLDVTLRCVLHADSLRARCRGGALDVVADMAEVWFADASYVKFHDPLAAAVIFEPDLIAEEAGEVEIELRSPRVPGMTHWRPDAAGPHRLAVDVQPERFFEHYFAVLG